MGEEIGMIDPDYSSISDYIDVESLNAYKLLLEQGFTERSVSSDQSKSRDNSNTHAMVRHRTSRIYYRETLVKVGGKLEEINVEKNYLLKILFCPITRN